MVSDRGRVWSVPRLDSMGRNAGGRYRAIQTEDDGRKMVSLNKDSRIKTHRVHQLVMRAFIGPCPPGQEVMHLDGDNGHNWLSNLEYGTKTENESHKDVHNTALYGERCDWAKLSEDDVVEIRRRYIGRGGPTQRELADEFGVSLTALHFALRGRNWTRTAEGSDGLPPLGESNHALSKDDLAILRKLYASGEYRQRDLAEMFNVSQPYVSRLVRNERR